MEAFGFKAGNDPEAEDSTSPIKDIEILQQPTPIDTYLSILLVFKESKKYTKIGKEAKQIWYKSKSG